LEAPTLGLSPWVDGFLQFPKNRVIDWGIGTEFSLIALFAGSPLFVPYITLGRDIGTRFASYCEFRILPPTVTPGILLRIIRNLSLFAEANLIMGDDVVNGMNS
jgi:hypothetical protein